MEHGETADPARTPIGGIGGHGPHLGVLPNIRNPVLQEQQPEGSTYGLLRGDATVFLRAGAVKKEAMFESVRSAELMPS